MWTFDGLSISSQSVHNKYDVWMGFIMPNLYVQVDMCVSPLLLIDVGEILPLSGNLSATVSVRESMRQQAPDEGGHVNDRELTYVKTIAEEGSVSAAARKLYIAQPSLSQSLQRIEESLGAKLFDRTSSGLRLTQAGKMYLAMANRVLKLYEDLQTELSDMEALASGSVRFGTTRLLGKMLLPEVLPAFHKRYPNIKLEIVEGNSKQLDRALMACEINFAVMHRLTGEGSRHIEYDVFWKDPFIVTAAADSPLAAKGVEREGYPYPVIDIRELNDEPLIAVPYGQRIRQVCDTSFMQAGVRPNIILEVRDYTTAQSLAARGMGYTVGPQSYTQLANLEDADVKFLSLDEKHNAAWALCIATFGNGSLSRADSELIRYFEDVIASTME